MAVLLPRSQGEHTEDGQGAGGGHEDAGGGGRLQPGAAGRGRSERRHHYRPALRCCEGWSGQPGLSKPRGSG